MIIKDSSKTDWENIINKPNGLIDADGDGIFENLKLPWDGVQNKPSAFPPEVHTHTISNIIDGALKIEKIISGSFANLNVDLTSIPANDDVFLFIVSGSSTGDWSNTMLLLPNSETYNTEGVYANYYYDGSSIQQQTGHKTYNGIPIFIGEQLQNLWITYISTLNATFVRNEFSINRNVLKPILGSMSGRVKSSITWETLGSITFSVNFDGCICIYRFLRGDNS